MMSQITLRNAFEKTLSIGGGGGDNITKWFRTQQNTRRRPESVTELR